MAVATKASVEYRDVPGFPGYRVGSDGTVWSRRVPSKGDVPGGEYRLLSLNTSRSGYLRAKVRDCNNKPKLMFVARLVLLSFVGDPPIGCQSCHNNGDKTDNRIDNLRWDSALSNHCDKMVHGSIKRGADHPLCMLSRDDVPRIEEMFRNGMSKSAIAREIGVTRDVVRRHLDEKSSMNRIQSLQFDVVRLRNKVISLEKENRALRESLLASNLK